MFSATKDRDSTLNMAKETMDNEGGPALDDAREKARHFRDDAHETAHAVKEDIEDASRRVGRHARDLAESAGHNLGDIGDALVHSMQKKPYKSAAAILGVGFVIGMLYRR